MGNHDIIVANIDSIDNVFVTLKRLTLGLWYNIRSICITDNSIYRFTIDMYVEYTGFKGNCIN